MKMRQHCVKTSAPIVGRVGEVELPEVDIAISNPPWGVQTHGADRAFIDAAMQCAPVVHMMHSAAATHLPKAKLSLKESLGCLQHTSTILREWVQLPSNAGAHSMRGVQKQTASPQLSLPVTRRVILKT